MNVTHFTISTLRILGIYCLIQSVLTTNGLVYALTVEEFNRQRSEMVVASLYPGAFLLLVGIALILCAPRLAHRLIPKPEEPETENLWTLEGFQAALFSAVGLLIFSSAIPGTFQWISQLSKVPAGEYWAWLERNTKVSIALSAIQFIFGICLFFGGRAISRFLLHLREWSSNKELSQRNLTSGSS